MYSQPSRLRGRGPPCPVALQDPHLGAHAPGGAVGEGMRGDMVLTW